MVATDGMKLTLGDTTLTMYLTPGHTLGTISTLIPVKDHGTAASRRGMGRHGLQLAEQRRQRVHHARAAGDVLVPDHTSTLRSDSGTSPPRKAPT